MVPLLLSVAWGGPPPIVGGVAQGRFVVDTDEDLVALERVYEVEGDLVFRTAVARAPALQGVSGALRIEAGVSEVDLPQLYGAGSIVVEGTSLVRVDLPALTWLTSDLRLAGNPTLVAVAAPKLAGELATLTVTDNDSLTALKLPEVAGASLDVQRNAALETLVLPALANAKSVVVAVNGSLGEVDLPGLARTGDVLISENGALRLVAFDALREAATVEMCGNNALVTVALPVASIDALSVCRNTALTTFVAGELRQAGRVSVVDNPAMSSLQLPALTGIVGAFEVRALGGLEALSLPTLGTAVDVTITANPQLERVQLPSLWKVERRLELSANPRLSEVKLRALKEVDGSLRIVDNASIVALDFPGLQWARGVEITGNAALVRAALPVVRRVSEGVRISDNGALETLDLSRLKSVKGAFAIGASPALLRVDLPELAEAQEIDLGTLGSAPEIELPRLGGSVSWKVAPGLQLSVCTVALQASRLKAAGWQGPAVARGSCLTGDKKGDKALIKSVKAAGFRVGS